MHPNTEQLAEEVRIVAHYAPVRVFICASWKTLIGVATLAVTLLVPWFVFVIEPTTPSGVALIGFMPLLYMLVSLPFGLRALRGAFAKNCYIRAGHEGVEIRFPDYNFHWSSLNFRYRMSANVYPWKNIREWHLRTYKVNGMKVRSSLILETTTGTLEVERFWFKEDSQSIMDALDAARVSLLNARAGKPHPDYPNTVWGDDGNIRPASEFEWASSVVGDYAVRFKLAGQPHPTYTNVVWNTAGKVDPAAGYIWAQGDGFNVVARDQS